MTARTLMIACFVVGVLLLIPFEAWWTIALGVAFLLAFIVVGAYALVGPGAVADEEVEEV
jgi:uncharacterized protein (DUF58 family)